MNKKLLNELYHTVFENDPSFKESCSRIDSKLREIADGYSGTLSKDEVECISDDFMELISDAHHDGFEIGMKFAFSLIMEMVLK